MGAGKKLWGWYPTTKVWVPLQVDVNGKVVVDASAIYLNDLGDTNVPTPADDDVLYWNNAASKWQSKANWVAAHKDSHDPEDGSDPLDTAIPVTVAAANAKGTSHSLARADHVHQREHPRYVDAEAVSAMGAKGDANPLHHDRYAHPGGIQCTLLEGDIPAAMATDAEVAAAVAATDKRFYALPATTTIWRCYLNRVSATPRTAIVSAVAGDTITLTGNHAYRFGQWGASPEFMHGDNVVVFIRNTSRGENAWVKNVPALNQLQVTNAADIAAWVNTNNIRTHSTGGANYEELDISGVIPDGATMIFCKAQCSESGVIATAKGLQISKEGALGTWSNTWVQVQNILVAAYPSTAITTARHLHIRDKAIGVDTLQHQLSVIAYVK